MKSVNKNKKNKIAVIGLGYVGLPLAIEFGKKGLEKFDLMITHEKFASFLAKQKDYQRAYENLAQFNVLSNEILESEKVKKAKTIGLNVELNEYLREIKRVESDYKKQQEILELEKSMERRKLIALVSILLISIILFYFYIQNSRLIQKNRLNGLRYKIQQNIVNATLSGQEMERKKIAYFFIAELLWQNARVVDHFFPTGNLRF